MTRLLPHVALLAVLLGAWFLRAEVAPTRELVAANPYAAFGDPESAYRLRTIELALASGHAPRTDVFLGESEAAAVPFPPLIHAALALLAAQTLSDPGGARELSGVDEAELERFVERLTPMLGLLAVGLAFAACAWLARGPRRVWGGIAAAALVAFAPTSIASEAAGTLRAAPWIEILSLAELAALAIALRAREQVDVTIGALLAGLFSGLSLLAGFEAWPLSVAAVGVLFAIVARVPRPQKRDAWRASVLFLAVTIAVVALAEPEGSIAFAAPRFDGGVQLTQLAFCAAAFPLAWWCLFTSRREPFHAVLLAAGFLAFACALFDTRFQPCLEVVFAASVAILVAEPPTVRWRVVALSAVGVVMLAMAITAWSVSRPVDIKLQGDLVEGLRWLRTNSSSPGPFNSADAPQDWRVWTAPELAGSVAYHARRPLIAADIASARSGSVIDATGDEFLAELDRVGAVYVVATPLMLRDESLTRGRKLDASSPLARFALADEREPLDGWVLSHATPTRITPDGRAPRDAEPAGPALAIWRRTSSSASTTETPSIR